MSVPTDCLRSALTYLAGYVDHEGAVSVVDVGRDAIHSDPLLIAAWDEATSAEDGPFAHAVYAPKHVSRSYTPDENVRVTYDHGADPVREFYFGDWRSVEVYGVGAAYREHYRRESGDFYTPVDDPTAGVRTVLE